MLEDIAESCRFGARQLWSTAELALEQPAEGSFLCRQSRDPSVTGKKGMQKNSFSV